MKTVRERIEELRKMDVEKVEAIAKYYHINFEDYDDGYDFAEAIAKAMQEEVIRDCMRDCI